MYTPNLLATLITTCSPSTSPFLLLSSCSLLFRNEGPLAFYKGLAPNLTRVVPATAINFVVYEKVSRFLLELRRG